LILRCIFDRLDYLMPYNCLATRHNGLSGEEYTRFYQMTEFLPGTEVQARGLRWEVVLSQSLGPQTLVRLRGLEGVVKGQEFDLLHPFEAVEPVIHDIHPEKAGSLRNWLVYHQAFLLEQALGPDAFLAVQPGRLRLEPYQLVPVLRAIRMSRPRLLLADGVGLGKTVQAGLVLTELMARRIAHRVLIVSPAGPLLEQWKTEMRDRFGLRLEVIDRAKLEDVRKSTELGANPFDHIPLGLVSIDFLKQERILDQLERSSYDVIIIDEIHHCMDLGDIGDREDSQRRKLAQVLARRCDTLLLLTATPHDGNDRSFASLCELLDPSLVDGNGSLRGEQYRRHVVRRLKKHIKDPETGEPFFKDRIVHPIRVEASPHIQPKFIELQRALIDLIAPELRRAFRARRYSDVLSFIVLLKRSVSTVDACLGTLQVVADRFQKILTEGAESAESKRQRLRTLRDYHRKLDRFGIATPEEEGERHLLENEDLAHQLADLQREVRSGSLKLKRTADVVAALDDLINLAEEASQEDPKLQTLIEEIKTIRREKPNANILVYTEYISSQQAAIKALKKAELGVILEMSGNDDESTRIKTTERFRAHENLILVSTDAAAEGLNLHERCHHLIHLELPFNPNRLEQRNGRIDRYGQRENPVVRYLYLAGTFEERILLRLIAKYERQRARLTFVPNTLGITTSSDASTEKLLKGLMDEDTQLFKQKEVLFKFTEPDEDKDTDEATREIMEEINKTLRGYEKATRTHNWLGDTGLNSEEKLMTEANTAHTQGKRVSPVDLARFVTDAILLDGGNISGKIQDKIFEVMLPPYWTHGLEDLPGYDSLSQKFRLTTMIEITEDSQEQPVGFLGHAHPLVRRALDRVRNLSFGNGSQTGQEIRASAVKANLRFPALLYTFLGRVMSQAGREFERVIAVEIEPGGNFKTYLQASEWLSFADPSLAIRTQGVWEKYFSKLGVEVGERARDTAKIAFEMLGEVFIQEIHDRLQIEQNEIKKWIKQRAREITGDISAIPIQPGLFQTGGTDRTGQKATTPSWASQTDSIERLAAFATDRSQAPSKRSEADGVLRIYQQRLESLNARLTLSKPDVLPLGVLMLVPE